MGVDNKTPIMQVNPLGDIGQYQKRLWKPLITQFNLFR
jgi:hypothetical protein